jgi:parallel beta-helix repeat protein
VRKSASMLVLLLFLSFILVSLPQIGKTNAALIFEFVKINADGSVEGTEKIQRDGNIYAFTDNIYGSISVEKDDIVIDGAGYALQGAFGTGIELTNRSKVVIKNVEIKACSTGIYIQGSSFNTILGNTILNNINGIHIRDQWLGYHIGSNSNTVSGNNITSNSEYGIKVERNSEKNNISENTVTKNGEGIYVDHFSCNTTVADNHVTGNGGYGIHIDWYSDNCVITGNYVAKNGKGIRLNRSGNILLRDNCMEDNEGNFEVSGTSVNDIDTSNTVNGKPIIYWVEEQDKTVPSDAGYVVLVKCENIIVQGLTLSNKQDGILLISTRNSRIIRNNIKDCTSGIYLYTYSNNITIAGNNITDNSYGIYLNEGYGNTIYGNNIANNSVGIYIVESELNNIYHNNFVNNADQVQFNAFWMPPFAGARENIWGYSYPYGGNYWSDYKERCPNSTELEVSGIWNTPYVLAESNQDNYPLMAPITVFDVGMWEWTSYNVDVISNSTVSGFSFNPDEGALIRFNVEGETGTIGFCRVRIPKDLLHTEDNWIVLVDENPVNPLVNEDKSNTYIYFTYQHTTKTVEIKGTTIIPEFPSWALLLVLLISIISITAIYRRRLLKSNEGRRNK